MWGFLFCPEIEILSGYSQVVVVFLDIGDALALEVGNAFGIAYQLFHLMENTLISRFYIDNRTEVGLMEDFVVLRFSATDADNALRHGEQGVHRRGIAVELVEDDI